MTKWIVIQNLHVRLVYFSFYCYCLYEQIGEYRAMFLVAENTSLFYNHLKPLGDNEMTSNYQEYQVEIHVLVYSKNTPRDLKFRVEGVRPPV